MKPRPRSYDPFATLYERRPQAAANDAITQAVSAAPIRGIGRSVLESRYPGMTQAISLMWGYPELNAYFDRIWLADGSQTTIDPEAMSELMLLAQIHLTIVPRRPTRSLATIYGTDYARSGRPDVWADVRRR